MLSLGPFQPKLYPFPETNGRRFNADWYIEYPLLEYSVEKDAAFCFACCLFPDGPHRSKASDRWVTEGCSKWSKMKGSQKNKKGKLLAHFSSESHKAALGDYCAFNKKNYRIDVLLDKAKRIALLEEEIVTLFNREVIFILLDITATLARQGLAFREGGNDDNGTF